DCKFSLFNMPHDEIHPLSLLEVDASDGAVITPFLSGPHTDSQRLHFQLTPNKWQRIAIIMAADSAIFQMIVYVNGVAVLKVQDTLEGSRIDPTAKWYLMGREYFLLQRNSNHTCKVSNLLISNGTEPPTFATTRPERMSSFVTRRRRTHTS